VKKLILISGILAATSSLAMAQQATAPAPSQPNAQQGWQQHYSQQGGQQNNAQQGGQQGERFNEMKQRMTQRIQEHINEMQQRLSCVQNASNGLALRACMPARGGEGREKSE
jgi:TolA-binding protein